MAADGFDTTFHLDCGCTLRLCGDALRVGDWVACDQHSAVIGYDPSNGDHARALRRVRDLLGLARTVYVAAKAAGATLTELQQLARAGTELAAALADLEAAHPGSTQVDDAIARAAAAGELMGMRISPFTPAGDIVEAAAKRVVRGTAR